MSNSSEEVRRELGGDDVPNSQYAAVFAAMERGEAFHTLDVIDTLWWKIRNQRREISRLNEALRHPMSNPSAVRLTLESATLKPRFWNKVHFEFEIGQRVVIRGSSIEADVTALLKDHDGEQYNICWWYNGARYTGWVFSREIIAKASS